MTFWKKFWRVVGIGTLAGLLAGGLLRIALPSLLDRIEYLTYYFRCQFAFGQQTPEQKEEIRNEEPDVCVVDIDDRSMERLGSYWGWNRGYHARMLQNLSAQFPGAIAFDIMFDNPEDRKYMDRFDGVLERVSHTGEMSEQLRRRILSSVDYDVRLMEATRMSGVTYHALRMAEWRDYAEHARSQIVYRTTPEWHEAMNPNSAIRVPLAVAGIEARPILDGCFPSIARAARGIGLVNIVPNEDGVVREVPLMYRFDSTDAVYLALSVRICANLFGTPNEEIEFKPGRWIDIGTPFKISKDSSGALACSYPGMRPQQVRAILANAKTLLDCPRGHNVDLMAMAVISRTPEGATRLELAGDTINEPVLSDLLAAPWGLLCELRDGETASIGEHAAFVKDAEGSYTVRTTDELYEWYFSDAHIRTLQALALERDSLPQAFGRKLLYYPFTVRRQREGLVSTIPALRGAALTELLRTPWSRIEQLGVGKRIEFGSRLHIPLTAQNNHIISYFGPARETFKKYSYLAVHENLVKGGLAAKVFVVGSTAAGLMDFISAPVDKKFPGVEVHASLIRSFLTGAFVRRIPDWANLLIVLLTGVIVGVGALALAPLPGGILAVVAITGYGFAAIQLFSDSRLWIEMARPILSIVLSYTAVMSYRYMTEEKDRKFLQSTFKAYLSPEIIDTMYHKKQFPKLGGEERVMTAYFTDIQSFSTFSEKLGSPTRLVELLNEYLTHMTNILIARGGTLDKYEGDAILAFYGAPMPMEDHAYQACMTALEMQRKLGDLRAKWHSESHRWPQIVADMRMRIGLNTGAIVTGNMGSTLRMNYTMMGDAVNLAARLESAAKQYGVYTMVSSFTLDAVGGAFETRPLDKILVVGKSEPVAVYELLAEKGALPAELTGLITRYREAYGLYLSRSWDEALTILREIEPTEPSRACAPGGMNPSLRLIGYCEACKANPPGKDWDGVTKMTAK